LTPQPAYPNEATFAAARSLSYAFGAAKRPLSDVEKRELQKRVEHIGNLIACEQAEFYGGFHEIKTADGARFVPFGPGDLDRHLRRRAEQLGHEISRDKMREDIDEAFRLLK
jgi:hypothetical protein